MTRPDPHSYHRADQPALEHLDWEARVDFASRTLAATARLRFAAATAEPLDLDTRGLVIERVTDEGGAPVPFQLDAPAPILGARLRLSPARALREAHIVYRTAPDASALQWLDPAQTAGGRHPFLFSQCQAIHARSLVPIQDTPAVRFRYRAQLTVPAPLTALMAAAAGPTEVEGDWRHARFEMPQPIPSYLLALAVGELDSRELGARTRVWAEPSVVEAAAREFAGVDAMLGAAERLFGPYDWERFDLLVMPPSFPYGGMENPRLTFLTPTLLAGDRSLVNVVAHELAHSWTGNLVTNATAEHFWLNEGFTVYAERRIVEALDGPETAALHAALGRRDLDRALARFAAHPALTHLRTHLEGVDPDDAFSEIPYEKGYLFLRTLEEAVGRGAFDRFLARYIATFRFRSITTEELLAFVEGELPGALARIAAPAWVDGPGIPPGAPAPRSARLEAVEAAARTGAPPDEAVAAGWSATEWQLYLAGLPGPVPEATRAALEARWKLSESGNHEILVTWLGRRLEADDRAAWPKVEEVLSRVGRMKYLRPLYTAWAKTPAGRAAAQALYARVGDRYHPIGRQLVESILAPRG